MKMNIYDFLKQLNKIEPDKNYSLISKSKILNEDKAPIFGFNVLKQITFSVAFSFVFIFIIFGISFLFGKLYPNFSALNPGSIKAEAEAIDFQIKLSKVIYETPQSSKNEVINNLLKKSLQKENNNTISNSTTSLDTATSVQVDEVLEYLAK
jgi:hypothetical protein